MGIGGPPTIFYRSVRFMSRHTDNGISGRPRVALLATEMCSHGGIQSYMWRIAEVIGAMAQEGLVEGQVMSLNDNTEDLVRHPRMPLRVRAWGAGGSKIRLAAYAFGRTPRTDLMLVGHIGPAPLAHLLHGLGRLKRWALVLHGVESWRRIPILKRVAAHSAAKIIATTRYTAAQFAQQNDIAGNLFCIVPLCADETPVQPSRGFRLHGGFKLLCVARLDASERYKGIDQVIEALSRLSSQYSDIHFNLVGDGSDRDRLERTAIHFGVSTRVTFWGRLSDEDLAAAYADCDVFVMPSKEEGFGIVFLEAMRHGKPCVGGNHGGSPEVIEDGKSGFLVQYEDVQALVDSIALLHREPTLRATLGLKGRELAQGRFSAHQFRQRYREVILEGAE